MVVHNDLMWTVVNTFGIFLYFPMTAFNTGVMKKVVIPYQTSFQYLSLHIVIYTCVCICIMFFGGFSPTV